jgi:ParB-like chromosome segregation protein Spo0J
MSAEQQLSLIAVLQKLSTGFAAKVQPIIDELSVLPDHERLAAINEIRQALHDICPMKHEPVDFVRWVPSDIVRANEYNPNTVAPPEMKLLQLSIEADGYTQPIVTWEAEGNQLEVIDGFHRNRVGKECKAVRDRVLGYLPVVVANEERTDKGDRIAATIRHNRARGKHRVAGMSEIVVELKRRNWSDEKIGRDLGMDPDEVLRLCQCSGLASMFADKEFSEAWEAEAITEDDTLDVTLEDPSGVDASAI